MQVIPSSLFSHVTNFQDELDDTLFDILFGIVVLQLDQRPYYTTSGLHSARIYINFLLVTCRLCQQRVLLTEHSNDLLWTLHGRLPQTRFYTTSALIRTLVFRRHKSVFTQNVMAPMVRVLTTYPARAVLTMAPNERAS